jgi:hypothetical protein
MQDLLSNKFQLYADKLFHLVSELKGFASGYVFKFFNRNVLSSDLIRHLEAKKIGLENEHVEQCLQLCGSLCISIESFINVMLQKRVQFYNFFNWLLKGTNHLISFIHLAKILAQSYLLEDHKSNQPQLQFNSASVMQLLQEGLHCESIER